MSQDKDLSVICCPDGTTKSVYHDELNIFDQGGVICCRVTDVEFDNDAQEWVATLIKTGQVIARGRNRQEVLKQEVYIVDDLLFSGHNIHP